MFVSQSCWDVISCFKTPEKLEIFVQLVLIRFNPFNFSQNVHRFSSILSGPVVWNIVCCFVKNMGRNFTFPLLFHFFGIINIPEFCLIFKKKNP